MDCRGTTLRLGVWKDEFCLTPKGAGGSTLLVKDNALEIPATSVPDVDVTGAGDAFFSGFLGHLLNHTSTPINASHELLTAGGIFASKYAASVIQKVGGPLHQTIQD